MAVTKKTTVKKVVAPKKVSKTAAPPVKPKLDPAEKKQVVKQAAKAALEAVKAVETKPKFEMKVYLNSERRTFLHLSEGRKWDQYITCVNGQVEVVKLSKEQSAQLRAEAHDEPNATPQQFAKVWLASTCDKTTRAKDILTAIKNGVLVDFVSDPEMTKESTAVVPGEGKKPAKKPAKANGEDVVSLKQLLKDYDIKLDPRDARIALRSRNDGGARAEGRWEWKKDSKELKEIATWLKKQQA